MKKWWLIILKCVHIVVPIYYSDGSKSCDFYNRITKKVYFAY